jgi:hypothetical protein
MGEQLSRMGKQETHRKLGWKIQEDRPLEEHGAYRTLKMDQGGYGGEALHCFQLIQDTVQW